jgi:hypothetical protein
MIGILTKAESSAAIVWTTIITLMCILSLLLLSCSTAGSQLISLRLYDSETNMPLTNMEISIYDGFDRNLSPFAGSDKNHPNDSPYHLEDSKTSTDGALFLDLAKFKDPYDAIRLKSNTHFKELHYRDNKISFARYQQEGFSQTVIAHYDYDLQKNLVVVKSIPDDVMSEPKSFKVIDIPMDLTEKYEGLNKYLKDVRLLKRLGVKNIKILEPHIDYVIIGTFDSDKPLGEVYYTIQDGWHLKNENERMEYKPGQGWLIWEQKKP